MITPKRFRPDGYYSKLPENSKLVTRNTKWGNPFKLEQYEREESLRLYREWITQQIDSGKLDITELRGKNLGCFCQPDESCHADILLELANKEANTTSGNLTKIEIEPIYQ